MNWLIVLMALISVAALVYVIVGLTKENARLKSENRRLKAKLEDRDGEDKDKKGEGDKKPEPKEEGGES